MTSRKRAREPITEGSLSILEMENTNATSAQNGRKRARASYNEAQSGSDTNTTDEELLDEQATQYKTQQRTKKYKANEAADNGIIETVTCTNFMCHEYLEVQLGPLINFIIGHNGSGKSAILTAITICLGGKATTTNRGQSLKSFIKEGRESFTLCVKIKNTSDSAYQHEVYGDSIIVERHISRSGSSNYKIKSAAGRLISNRKVDLEEICDYFALQIDNPMNVLTQDMARQFLNNSSPAEKYKFFMKGTQLEHLDGDYLQMEQSVDVMDQNLFQMLKDLEQLEEDMRRAKSLLLLSKKHDTLRARIKGFSDQMAWAQVEEQERDVVKFDRDLQKAEEMIVEAKRKEVEAGIAFDLENQACEESKILVTELTAEVAPIYAEKERVKTYHDSLKADAVATQTDQRNIKEHLRAAETRIIRATADIEEEYRRLGATDGGIHARRLSDLEEKKARLLAAKTKVDDHDNHLRRLKANKASAEADLKNCQPSIIAKRDEIRQCEDHINNLLKDRGQQQGAYPTNMTRLVNAIRQDDGFIQKPVGPMGSHVRLLKPLWSSVLEKSFGAALNSFVVTSKQDQSRLSSLMHKVGCSCPILIGNNTRIDTSNHEPDPSFDTILRVLEIDNELVKKQMIINQAIEQTVLTEHYNDGVAALEGNKSRNIKQCYTLNIKAGSGLRISRGFGNGLSQSYLDPFIGIPRMKTDVEYQINAQRGILERLKSEIEELEENLHNKEVALHGCHDAITAHSREAKALRIAVQRIETSIEELQDALDHDAVEEGRLDALKEHLKEAQDEKSTHEGSYEESVLTLDRIKEAMRVSLAEMSALDLQIAEAKAKIKKAENKALKASTVRANALQSKNAAIESVQALEDGKRRTLGWREEKVLQVTDFTAQASEICPRVPVDQGETGQSLDRKLEKLHGDLKKYEEKIGGNKLRIAEDAKQKAASYMTGKREVDNLEKLAQNLKMTLVNRKERWRQFQRCITARARVQFFYLLSERGFRGRLLANHKTKQLDLNVEPDETRKGKGRQTKTLSGGEKSFSTICLLLSLWDAMGAPIRCLDEFDVFMDSVNRDVSMRMLIIAARRSVGKQFILITPQSMGNVPVERDVKIIKLSDPERGQTTISFPQA